MTVTNDRYVVVPNGRNLLRPMRQQPGVVGNPRYDLNRRAWVLLFETTADAIRARLELRRLEREAALYE